MSAVLLEAWLLLLTLGLGSLGTWYFCQGRRRMPFALGARENPQARLAGEVLQHLHELATRVAVDVQEHSGRIETLNAELTSVDGGQAVAIIRVVAQLLEANQQMQARLATTEDRLREQAQQLQSHARESRTDPLTLLANRRAFDEEIARRLAESPESDKPFSMILFDIDRFKQFNDVYGHLAGDELLRGVGRILRRQMREMDLVARYGGEEFAVILPGLARAAASQAALAACRTLAKTLFPWDGKELRVTISAGVTQYRAGESDTELVKRTDTALYAAKEAGRNRVYGHDGQRVYAVEANARPEAVASPSAELTLPPSLPEPPQTLVAELPCTVAEMAPAAIEISAPVAKPPGKATPELPPRTTFCQQVRSRLAEWKRGGPSFSVLLLELDQATHLTSHRDALQTAQQLVTDCVVASAREMDNVARYSPCCLALLLPGADLAAAIQVAERLRRALGECRLSLGSDPLPLTASIGVVGAGEQDDMIAILRRAEAALDAASRRGGNCTYYHNGERCAPISALLEVMGYLT